MNPSPPSSTKPPTGLCARKEWWKRDVVKRTISFIESEFERVVSRSPFLQQGGSGRDATALFHRSEILTGARLGKGGFAVVYEVRGFLLREDVSCKLTQAQRDARKRLAASAVCNGQCRYAIKHLQLKLLDNPKEFQRAAADLVNEAAFLEAVDHPNILSLQGCALEGMHAYIDGRHDGFFIITERLSETLEERIARWNAEPSTEPLLEDKLKVAQQLAEALEYLHSQRVVYRDLKPANIGFSVDKDTLQLFDFGLSRELPESDFANDVFTMSGVGTRRYMAVEVVKGLPYNCKADVYGWSMIFWQMLCLRKPYQSYSANDHLLMVCKKGERPSIPSHLPQSLVVLLRQSWIGSVNKRLAMDEVCRRLAFVQEEMSQIETPRSRIFSWGSTWMPASENARYPVKRQFSSSSISTVSLESSTDESGSFSEPPFPSRESIELACTI